MSAENAKHGWKQWCEAEMPDFLKGKVPYVYTLKKNAKILHVWKERDLRGLPLHPNPLGLAVVDEICLDFEKLSKNYDAVELHLSDGESGLYHVLYTWDCDSILIMNPDIVEVEKEETNV